MRGCEISKVVGFLKRKMNQLNVIRRDFHHRTYTLCTDDAGYQAFRAKVHKPWLQMLFLALPLFVRKRIAARMRANSKEANSSKSLAIMDVNQNAVVSAMEKHQVQWLIHGHTHRPAVHELIANQQPAFRVVLGAWHTEGSMVKVTADDVELIHFPF